MTCMRYDCPECAPLVRKRRAMRARKRLDAGRRGRPILYTVFTVPPEHRELFVDRKNWRKLCRETYSILRYAFGAEFALEASHPHGDSEDGGDPGVFHPHMNFLWIAGKGRSSYVNVVWLRRLYALALRRCGARVSMVSDVWHHYYRQPGDLSRRVGYVCRPFPGFSSWAGSMRWYGHYPRGLDMVLRCPVCHSTFLYIGRSDLMEYLERQHTGGVEPGGP